MKKSKRIMTKTSLLILGLSLLFLFQNESVYAMPKAVKNFEKGKDTSTQTIKKSWLPSTFKNSKSRLLQAKIEQSDTSKVLITNEEATVNGFATGSFIFGTLSVLSLFVAPGIGFFFGVIAIILGLISLGRIKKKPKQKRGKKLTLAGLIMAGLIFALFIFLFFAFMSA